MDQNILFYSKKCPNCKKLFDLLERSPPVVSKMFMIICVDNKKYKIPPVIKSVPSAIITTPSGSHQVYSGVNLMNFIKTRIGSQQRNPGTGGGRGMGSAPRPMSMGGGGGGGPPRGPSGGVPGRGGGGGGGRGEYKEPEPEEWDSFVMNNLSGNFAFIDEDKNERIVEKNGFASLNAIHSFRINTPDDEGPKGKEDIKPVSYSMNDPSLQIPQGQMNRSNRFADEADQPPRNRFDENDYGGYDDRGYGGGAGGGGGPSQSRNSYNPNEFNPRNSQAFDPNMFRDRGYEGGSDSRSNARKSEFDARMEQMKSARDFGMPQPIRRM